MVRTDTAEVTQVVGCRAGRVPGSPAVQSSTTTPQPTCVKRLGRDGHLKECDLKMGVQGGIKGLLLDCLDPRSCHVAGQLSGLSRRPFR